MEITSTATCINEGTSTCLQYAITTTLPNNFSVLPYIVYVIGGLLIFFIILFFLDFLRRSIR